MAIGESAGIFFRIRADSSQAIQSTEEFRKELKELEKAEREALTPFQEWGRTMGLSADETQKLGKDIQHLAYGATAAASAITAGVTIAVGAFVAITKQVYDASVAFSEYGSEIYNASVKTGLTTDTISALRLAADRSGVSMESLGTIVSRFSKLVGEAEQGSDKAKQTLIRLGIDPKKAIDDLDGALGQVFAKIHSLPDPISKATLAQQAFGKAGTEVLKVIDDFNGNLPEAIAKARELGLVMSAEDAAAADQFGDTMDTLKRQIQAVELAIGKEFLPEFQKMADAVSDFLKDNKDQIKSWAENVHRTLRGVVEVWKDATKAAEEYHLVSLAKGITALDPNVQLGRSIIDYLKKRGADAINAEPLRAKVESRLSKDPNTFRDFEAEKEAAKEAERKRKEAQRKAEQLAERDLASAIRIEATNLQNVQKSLQSAYEEMRKTLSEGGVIEGFAKATNETTKHWAENLNLALTYLEELEKRALKKDATANERAELQQKQDQRRHDLKLEQDKEVDENEKKYWEEKLRRGEVLADQAQQAYELEQERIEERRKQFEKDAGFGIIPGLAPHPTDINPDVEAEGPFAAWTRSWDEFFTRIEEDAPTITAVFEDLGHIMQGAFLGLAQAIGSVVQQWVLYGNTGPAVMRKMLAAVLASVAAEAAVKAIMATAEGFYFLATGNYASAANAFTAAAFYGAVAGVAALAGRAVAGNSFKQQTSAATGGSSAGRSSSGGGNQGQAYSPYGDQAKVIEQGRNAPAVTVTISDDSQFLGKMLKFHIQNNNEVRDMIRTVAAT